ncbi:9602_t:CDS:1, partial [Paraglomus brasilianum]
MEMTAKEYVNIDNNNIQLWEEPTDETIIQKVLILMEEGMQGETIPSSDDDEKEEERSIITYKE